MPTLLPPGHPVHPVAHFLCSHQHFTLTLASLDHAIPLSSHVPDFSLRPNPKSTFLHFLHGHAAGTTPETQTFHLFHLKMTTAFLLKPSLTNDIDLPSIPASPPLYILTPSDVHSSAVSSQDSSRDLLPWIGEPPDYRTPVDPATKEERMRMLQRESGPRANGKDGGGDDPHEGPDGRPLAGSVDQSGNLVAEGPKKRVSTRILQLALAFVAGIPSIYVAVVRVPLPSVYLLRNTLILLRRRPSQLGHLHPLQSPRRILCVSSPLSHPSRSFISSCSIHVVVAGPRFLPNPLVHSQAG